MNYFSGGTNKRGYYLSVTPVQIERQGNNVMIESYTAFSGIKKLILEVERQSPKSAEKAKELAESSIPELKQYVLNQMIERGEIPQNMPNPEPEPMPNEGNRIIFDLKDFDPNTTEVIGRDANFEGFPNITDLGVLLEIRGDANFHNSQVQSLGNLQKIGGYADFRNSQIQSLGNLQMIGGSTDFENSQVQSLGNLQTIWGFADFRNSQVQNLGNLQTIGGGADFRNSQVQSLGNLQTIEGFAYFEKSKVQSLGNLQTIGGNAYFENSRVQNLGNLQTIGGGADFRDSRVQNLGNLQTIGIYADFRNSQVQDLGNLQTIGGYADFRYSQIQSLGNLQTIGGDAEFGNRTDLQAEWENRQENPEPMPEEEEINAEEIRAEIVALEEVLEVLEGEDRQSIQEEIEILKLALGDNLAKGGGVRSVFSNAKSFGKRALDKSVKLGKSAKQKTQKAIHESKKKIALDVLYDVKENLAKGRDESIAIEKAFRIVEKKYAEGGGVEIPKNKSLRHFILNEMSAGMIANRVPYSDYATIDKIRIQAVQILNRDGDREYSLQSVSDLIQEALLEYEENKSEMNFANGGGVGELPPKGELTNKDNFLLKYEKKGGDYEFYIYKPETKKVSGYNQVKHICVNSDCPHKMTYEQFSNYLYAELYLDDMKYANGGEIFVCPVGTEIQTLIFDKSMFNLREAKAWAKKNNFENAYVDGKLNTLRIRQKDPAMFTEDGFRTIQLRQGVQAVIGCPKRKISRKR